MGVTAAIVVGAATAATVGASVYATHKQSEASKSAAKTQADATREAAVTENKAAQDALAFQREQWAQAQRNAQPWIDMGGQANLTLQQMMGFKPKVAAPTPAPVPPPTAPPPAGGAPIPSTGPTPRNDRGDLPTPDTAGPIGRIPMSAIRSGGYESSQGYRPWNGYQAANVGGAETVTLRAPDGTTKVVPAWQKDHWLSKGATLVSPAA